MIPSLRTVLRALVSFGIVAAALQSTLTIARFGYGLTLAGKAVLAWTILYLAISLFLGAFFVVWRLREWIRSSAETETIKYRKIGAAGGDNRSLEDT
jgi:hypothetical protein